MAGEDGTSDRALRGDEFFGLRSTGSSWSETWIGAGFALSVSAVRDMLFLGDVWELVSLGAFGAGILVGDEVLESET